MKNILLLFLISCASVSAQKFTLSNPVTETWVRENLRKSGPKIILTKEKILQIKKSIQTDAAVKAYYQYLYQNAVSLITLPVLERRMEGRRLLTITREAVSRLGALSVVYALSGEKRFLNRVNDELTAVCNFSDWNPSHFLDVAEAAYAVSIGLDWTLGDLPEETKRLAKKSLLEKAIQPSLDSQYNGWMKSTHNWNQVCHGGMSVAAVAIADEYPALAAQIIARALQYMPLALDAYAPDGVYPEGASYWSYGTSYTLLTISVFESAFGTDFGMSKAPGFLESATFVSKLAGPSGLYFNYFDSGEKGYGEIGNQELLSWFAQKTGNRIFFDKNKLAEKLMTASVDGKNISKMNGSALSWIVASTATNTQSLPVHWKGEGKNPIAILGSSPDESAQFFLGAKGGSASQNHGNMDAGSFVFELNGVRWSVDPGNQDYTKLEAIMGNALWNNKQDSKRWTLLTKNNFGHSTLTVNDQFHNVDGFAGMSGFNGETLFPEVSFDLTAVLKGQLKYANRKFTKKSSTKLRIEDAIEITDSTKIVSWTMMTEAEVASINGGALLKQHGKTLQLIMLEPVGIPVKITLLDPPPLSYDKIIPGLKRIEFRIPAALLTKRPSKIVVELSGE